MRGSMSAARFSTAPDFPRERRQDRFKKHWIQTWRGTSHAGGTPPSRDSLRSDVLGAGFFPEGMLICTACGLSLATQSDMRRACFRGAWRSSLKNWGSSLPWTSLAMTRSPVRPARRMRAEASDLLRHAVLKNQASEEGRRHSPTASGNGC